MSDTGTDSTEQSKSSALDAIKAQRAALQNFYKLQHTGRNNGDAVADGQIERPNRLPGMVHRNSSSYSVVELDPSKIEDVNDFISTEPYLNILKMENKVLDKLNSSKSEIKSIIYNNYYELIKINTILDDLLTPHDDNVYLESISDNLATIRAKMEKVKSLDLDIFGDLQSNNEGGTRDNGDDTLK
jgi:hypothetical protein